MKAHSSTRRSAQVLLRDAAAHHAQEIEGRNQLVVDIAEIDARKVYRRAGYDSIHSYCMSEFDLTAKAAFHRIHVARVAWRFPAALAALQAGRLYVTAVGMLARHLTEGNVEGLVDAAADKSKPEIQRLLAERFPSREPAPLLLEVLTSVPPSLPMELVPEGQRPPEGVEISPNAPMESAPECQRPPGGFEAPAPVTLVPALPPRFPLKVSLTQETHEKLRHARELLGHQVPSGDVAEVLDRALDALIAKIERRKFGATDRPRRCKTNQAAGSRYVPADVRRAVAARDGGRCTFTSESGKRCPARKCLEFDHIQEIARGGQSTEANLRLRCRAHNQYAAEQTYGSEFMRHKREEAQRAAEERARTEAQAKAAAERAREKDVTPWLRSLGFRAAQAHYAAELCESIPDASLEERVKVALSYLAPRTR